MLVGYARASTAEQNPNHQTDALARAGVARDDIHVDHASGAKSSRPKLDLVLRILRDGDVLVVTRLDRLGRSVLHLVTLGAQLRDRGVGLQVVEQGIDTATAEGRAMFGMLGVPRSTVYGHLNKATVGTRPHAQKTVAAAAPSAERAPSNDPAGDAHTHGARITPKSRACPSCGHEPTTREEATTQRADLAVTWLSADPHRPGQLLPRQHCRHCQPHGPVLDLACAVCGDGPILAGDLATAAIDAGPPPKPVQQWLAADGWQLTPELLCPDHIPPAHLSS